MAAQTLRPNAGLAAIIGETNQLIAAGGGGNVSGAVALRVIRGSVSATGVKVAGEGFTCARSSTGFYTITLTAGFVVAPVMLAAVTDSAASMIAVSAQPAPFDQEVRTYDSSGAAANKGFSFVIWGVG